MVMSNPILNLNIDDERWENVIPSIDVVCEKILITATEYLNSINVNIGNKKLPISVNLMLSNDDVVHQLNLEFRNKDKPTNVLSFANIDSDDFEVYLQETDIIELGDIIVALETLQNEAILKNISLFAHFSHLFVHGILHLFGFDHQNDDEAEEMENMEVLILQKLGINNPYDNCCE